MSTEIWGGTANSRWLQLRSLWQWIARLGRSTPRRLRLAESLPLGDRRFVAVLELDGSRFLLGATPSSLVLLARLDGKSAGSTEATGLTQDLWKQVAGE
ncbi:MAG TPA: flagellar biosynthetic protein FliO [Candidatus Sulfotelmatobacter sp.]